MEQVTIAELETKTREDLVDLAKDRGVPRYSSLKKQELVVRVLQAQAEKEGNLFAQGTLQLVDDGYGFLRGESMLPTVNDVYVSQSQVRRFALRTGDLVMGQVRPPKDSEKYYGLLRVEAVNGVDPDVAKQRPHFENLTAIFPQKMINLETGRGGMDDLSQRVINLMVVLIGERPEEVTDMKRSVTGDVIASTFDEPVEDHTRVADMALDRAKRLVEGGKDVMILLDSITRLTRAYNLAMPTSGRTLSGGMDPVALYPPKRFFGAARNTEESGSLTVVATCLVDTNSRMDEVIYEEFKGTGNMEIHLDRRLADRRIYPSIDVQRSSTRREELLLDEKTLQQVWLIRRMMAMIGGNSPNPTESTERLLERISRTKTNEEFLSTLKDEI